MLIRDIRARVVEIGSDSPRSCRIALSATYDADAPLLVSILLMNKVQWEVPRMFLMRGIDNSAATPKKSLCPENPDSTVVCINISASRRIELDREQLREFLLATYDLCDGNEESAIVASEMDGFLKELLKGNNDE